MIVAARAAAKEEPVSMTLPVKPRLDQRQTDDTPRKSGRDLYFFSGATDLLLLGGTSVILYLLLTGFQVTERTAWSMQLALFLSYVCNYPHYAASYQRLYSSWSEAKKYPDVAFVWPAIFLALACASLMLPGVIAPWYCKLILIVNGYHYSGQTYGIALIFARKAGIVFNRLQKLALAGPIYISWLYPTSAANTIASPREEFYGVDIPSLCMPVEIVDYLYRGFSIAVLVYAALTLWCSFKKKQHLPFVFHLVVATQLIWFSIGSGNDYFNEFVPFFHCMQYLVIVTYFYFRSLTAKTAQSQDATDVSALGADTPLKFLASGQFTQYYCQLILIGVALFWLIPHVLALTHVCDILLAQAVVITFINLHHFFIDGAVWKLKRPDVGQPLTS